MSADRPASISKNLHPKRWRFLTPSKIVNGNNSLRPSVVVWSPVVIVAATGIAWSLALMLGARERVAIATPEKQPDAMSVARKADHDAPSARKGDNLIPRVSAPDLAARWVPLAPAVKADGELPNNDLPSIEGPSPPPLDPPSSAASKPVRAEASPSPPPPDPLSSAVSKSVRAEATPHHRAEATPHHRVEATPHHRVEATPHHQAPVRAEATPHHQARVRQDRDSCEAQGMRREDTYQDNHWRSSRCVM
jgi:hypothetical protein